MYRKKCCQVSRNCKMQDSDWSIIFIFLCCPLVQCGCEVPPPPWDPARTGNFLLLLDHCPLPQPSLRQHCWEKVLVIYRDIAEMTKGSCLDSRISRKGCSLLIINTEAHCFIRFSMFGETLMASKKCEWPLHILHQNEIFLI